MTAKIRTLIIEDEEPARNLLRTFLESFEEIDLIGECSDGFSGLKTINELQPDLVFLDIQMPRLTGFELLELLDDIPEIVFTTAYDEYALKAFDLNAVDYLMKPFSKQRLRQAVDKVIERFRIKSSGKEKVSQLVEQMHQKARPLERIVSNPFGHTRQLNKFIYLDNSDLLFNTFEDVSISVFN
jgi:two-component system, LytTR family, response regulator